MNDLTGAEQGPSDSSIRDVTQILMLRGPQIWKIQTPHFSHANGFWLSNKLLFSASF